MKNLESLTNRVKLHNNLVRVAITEYEGVVKELKDAEKKSIEKSIAACRDVKLSQFTRDDVLIHVSKRCQLLVLSHAIIDYWLDEIYEEPDSIVIEASFKSKKDLYPILHDAFSDYGLFDYMLPSRSRILYLGKDCSEIKSLHISLERRLELALPHTIIHNEEPWLVVDCDNDATCNVRIIDNIALCKCGKRMLVCKHEDYIVCKLNLGYIIGNANTTKIIEDYAYLTVGFSSGKCPECGKTVKI